MAVPVTTRRGAIGYSAKRVGVSTFMFALFNVITATWWFGTDLDIKVEVRSVIIAITVIGTVGGALAAVFFGYTTRSKVLHLSLARAELFRLSMTDKLTGLLNRRGFDEEAKKLIVDSTSFGSSALILMCDIDRFKSINDRFGHDVGDIALVKVSETLRTFASKNKAVIGRHGGEEFVAILMLDDSSHPEVFAEEMRRCCELEIATAAALLHVTVSVGYAIGNRSEDFSQLVREADKALYVAKNAGRNRIAKAA